ncbi:MAG TPA: hypothetical protein VF183_12010 [Acidimicrobiales bacterium]
MAKNKAKKRRRRAGQPPNTAAPKVHVQVAIADTDLRTASQLVKPALLYADRVTIYSPAASMIRAFNDFAGVKHPRQRVLLTLQLVKDVPEFASQLNVPGDTLEQLKRFLSVDRWLVRRIGALYGAGDQIEQLYEQLDGLDSIWQDQMPEVLAKAKEAVGADDLLVAVQAGALTVGSIIESPTSDVIADLLRAATGNAAGTTVDDFVLGFTGRLVEMLGDRRSFPLFDAQSSGLIRALERAAFVNPSTHAMQRGAEVSAAASFMGCLPYFPELPMDEVLDLRRSLSKPLIRFREALARLSREFDSRPIDEEFEAEVEDAWRRDVAPALADIREALAEHGLLKEVASIALGDPRRLLVEAGGVLAAAHGDLLSLSALLTAGLAAGLPLADVAGRAIQQSRAGERKAKTNAFYFLHRLDEESRRRV